MKRTLVALTALISLALSTSAAQAAPSTNKDPVDREIVKIFKRPILAAKYAVIGPVLGPVAGAAFANWGSKPSFNAQTVRGAALGFAYGVALPFAAFATGEDPL